MIIAEQLQLKPNFVIIEGPDGVGKTTLATVLACRLNAMYWHTDPMLEQYRHDEAILTNIEYNLCQLRRSVVLDRHWPSECAYGPVFRPNAPKYDWHSLAHSIELMHGVYIFCNSKDGYKHQMATANKPLTEGEYHEVENRYEAISHAINETPVKLIRYHRENDGGAHCQEFLSKVYAALL